VDVRWLRDAHAVDDDAVGRALVHDARLPAVDVELGMTPRYRRRRQDELPIGVATDGQLAADQLRAADFASIAVERANPPHQRNVDGGAPSAHDGTWPVGAKRPPSALKTACAPIGVSSAISPTRISPSVVRTSCTMTCTARAI